MNRIVIGGVLLWWCAFLPAATLNVTFTVKNDGTVVASNDWGGTFDNTTGILTLSANNMPAEFRDGTPVHQGHTFWGFNPVGYDVEVRSVMGGTVPMLLRLRRLHGKGTDTFNPNGPGPVQCTNQSRVVYGNYITLSDGQPYTGQCRSVAGIYYKPYGQFIVENIELVFFDGQPERINRLANLKTPAGSYHATRTFQLRNALETKPLTVNTTIIVEPSLSAVNMPITTLPLTTHQEAGMMVGQGAIIAYVSGTLGRRLTITPSVRGPVGKLTMPGRQTVIPYTLDVTPLGHDYLRRNLIDGLSDRLNPVVLPLDGVLFDYQLRFDVNFRVPMQGLVNGRYHSSVTLMFSTSEV